MGLRSALFAAALAAALAAPATPAAGAGAPPDPPPSADLTTTGKDSELVETLAITKRAGDAEEVVMSLGPEDLPRFRDGDSLRLSAEMQVSTTCVFEGPRCIGRRYELSPRVAMRAVVAAGPKLEDVSQPLTGTTEVRCKQRRPDRNHHCTLVIPSLDVPIPDREALSCPDGECYVNLVAGAHNKRAKRGNVVVVGADRPDGSVVQDKGRLNVVHARQGTPLAQASSSDALVNPALPLNEGKHVKRRVVHSIEIPAPREGDVLSFDASFLATVIGPHNAYISSRVIVAETPTATQSEGLAKQISSFRGSATESNGFNCTLGPSGYRNPCTVVKAGATRITETPTDAQGAPVPLYLNLVSAAKPLLVTKQVRAWHGVELSPGAGFELLRYESSS